MRGDPAAAAVSAAKRRRLAFFDPDFCLVSDQSAVLAALLRATTTLSRASMANVQLVDHRDGSLYIAAEHGFGPDFLSYFAIVNDQQSACGLAFARGRTVHVDDVMHSPGFGDGMARGVVLDDPERNVLALLAASTVRRLLRPA
jgi:hypothetical protein